MVSRYVSMSYIGKVLQDFEMTDANTVTTPTLAREDLHRTTQRNVMPPGTAL